MKEMSKEWMDMYNNQKFGFECMYCTAKNYKDNKDKPVKEWNSIFVIGTCNASVGEKLAVWFLIHKDHDIRFNNLMEED